MKRLAIALFFSALAFAATTKVVPIKNMDPDRLMNRLKDLRITEPWSHLALTTVQNNIVLTGPDDAVAAAEQIIKALDVPEPKSRDIEITGYIVMASTRAGETTAIQPDLEPVIRQFRNLLNYKSFRVLDTIILRGKEQSYTESTGYLAVPGSPSAKVVFKVEHPSLSEDVVHLRNLRLQVYAPVVTAKGEQTSEVLATIATDADIKAGQKVAIGKASVDANGDALILVVSAKVVD